MSLTIDTLLKSQGEVHLTEIEIKWYFTPQNDEENSIEIQGTFNIDSFYDSQMIEIQNPRTSVTGFYEIFNKLQFTDINTGSTFLLEVNHITEYMVLDDLLTIEFVFHRSIPQIAFQIEDSIIAGAVEIKSSSENLLIFQSFIDKNLRLHFGDHIFKIPRCNHCGSALTLHSKVDLEDEVINDDFICMDCYTVINNFYNLLEKEVYKITDPHQMKDQRDNFVKFLMTGKKNASQIEETQLQHFYNLLIIYVEYLSGNLDAVNVLIKIQAVQTIAANNNYPLLQHEAENLIDKIDLRPKDETESPETWAPPKEADLEPIPPPLPLGTPSSATVLPKEEELSNGLQSLEDVQAELQSTLDALSQIESDLNPHPITPTDHMHAVNAEFEEESDKIPTYDDIEETFSDLESLEFPDIQFGTSDLTEIKPPSKEDQLQHNPELLNPPAITNHEETELHFQIPTIQKLPGVEQQTEETLSPPEEDSSAWNIDKENFSGERAIETTQDYELGTPVDQDRGENTKESWGTDEPVNPPPRLNPPQIISTQLNSPEVTEPLLQEVTVPDLNFSNQSVPPTSESPSAPLEEIPEKNSDENKMQNTNPTINSRSAFFNSLNNGQMNPPSIKEKPKLMQSESKPQSRPKQTREKRKRNAKARRIICSFCGHTIDQGKVNCPNCGSPVR